MLNDKHVDDETVTYNKAQAINLVLNIIDSLKDLITNEYQSFTFTFNVKKSSEGDGLDFLNCKLHKGEVHPYPSIKWNDKQEEKL